MKNKSYTTDDMIKGKCLLGCSFALVWLIVIVIIIRVWS